MPEEERKKVEVEHRLLVREAVYLLGVQLKQKGKRSIGVTAAKKEWDESVRNRSFNDVSRLALQRFGRQASREVHLLH